MQATGFDAWVLSLIVFVPLAGALLMLLVPRSEENTHKLIALVASLAAGGFGVYLLTEFDYDRAGELQFVVDESWIDVISSRYSIGIDGMALPLLALTLFIVPLCILYSFDHIPSPGNAKAFLILILILQTGMAGTFVAQDLILFFVFFEVVLLPMYFLIGVWGGENRQYASTKFFLYTLFGSALMLLSFLALFFQGGAESFAIGDLAAVAGDIDHDTQLLIFGGMFMGFGIKVPMFPFHTWLPDAHTEAPTVGSVILAAVLLKLGTYGFIKIAIPILPDAAESWAWFIGLLAVIGIIYGALGCLAQTSMKRLIAFSSVAHMGFVMLGISTLTDFGMNAAIFGMVAHGLITGMLFFCAGSIKERYHTYDIPKLGGMLTQVPKLGWILGFCVMASLGLPGLAGFWGEFPAILSAYNPAPALSEEVFRVYMVVAAIGTVLAAGYLLWMFQRTAFGMPPGQTFVDPNHAGDHDDHGDGHGGHGHDGLHATPEHADHGNPGDPAIGAQGGGGVAVAERTATATAAHAQTSVGSHSIGGHGHDEGAHGDDHDLHDVGIFEWIAWLPILAMIVVLGVYPNLLFRVTDDAVMRVAELFQP